jgi:riboflavin kinase/FMN adenylyltransferase
MEVIRGFKNFPEPFLHSAVAIGNFDGVHAGHQRILKFLSDKASKLGLSSLVLTFSPHPEKILGEKATKMIQTLEQRKREIEKFGIDAVLIVPFDQNFSNLSAGEFVRKIIVNTLKARAVVVGENFRYGKNREGDIPLLRKLASESNFQVHSIPTVKKRGTMASSSLIRNLLQQGQVEKANLLLGRNYEIEGKVIKGKSRGKSLGFPTANIETKNEIVPPGIFISFVGIESETFRSLTNVGNCPTFNQKETNIESYIINFARDLYGKTIRIGFIKKIRDEIKFKTAEDLKAQMKKDLPIAKSYFKLKNL